MRKRQKSFGYSCDRADKGAACCAPTGGIFEMSAQLHTRAAELITRGGGNSHESQRGRHQPRCHPNPIALRRNSGRQIQFSATRPSMSPARRAPSFVTSVAFSSIAVAAMCRSMSALTRPRDPSSCLSAPNREAADGNRQHLDRPDDISTLRRIGLRLAMTSRLHRIARRSPGRS